MSARMLQRDHYSQDYTRQFLPGYEQPTLSMCFDKLINPATVFIFSRAELNYITQNMFGLVKNTFMGIGVGLVVALFYKKLPVLKDYPSWKVRLPVSLLFITSPFLGVTRFYTLRFNKLKEEMMKEKAAKYQQYLLTGDVRVINEGCLLEELVELPAAPPAPAPPAPL